MSARAKTASNDQGGELQDARGGRFWMDDDIIDQHAAKIGPYALAVYTYLCRRANKQKQAIPSLKRMGIELSMSRSTVQKAIETLEAHRLISVTARKLDDSQEYTSNLYTILDASRGIGVPSHNTPIPSHGTPYTATQPTVYRETVTKEDTIKEDTIKDIAADAAPPQKPANPSKKKATSRQTPIQPEAVMVPPPPVAPEQAAADLAAWDALESASGRELPPPTGTSKDAIERALILACVPSGERREINALMGQIRKAGLIIREGDICTADDIMARCVGKGSLFYTTHFAENDEDGLTKPPTPMTIATWIWKLEECRSRKFKPVRAPIDYDQALAEAEARAARSREQSDPSPFKPIIPAWQVLTMPRRTA